jgi:NAD+ synthase (glutamine-hydrolysing)
LALAQLNLVVGDLGANVEAMKGALQSAEAQDCDLCIFPELSVTGYPPEDLLMKPRFVSDNLAALHEDKRRK